MYASLSKKLPKLSSVIFRFFFFLFLDHLLDRSERWKFEKEFSSTIYNF